MVSAEWWASHFDDNYLREYEPVFTPERDHREVGRLIDLLGLPVGARVLDCPCGQGRHARLLAAFGYAVDAVDFSSALLDHAKASGAVPGLRYSRGDMRDLPGPWTGRFDAVLNLTTSFGFFAEPGDDARVIREFGRVLRPGGLLLWHGASRDGVAARFLARDWWRTRDGTLVVQERFFDPLSGILTIDAEQRGPAGVQDRTHRIRLYTATRLAELCRDAGLTVETAYDGWSPSPLRRASPEMLLVARKDG